MKLKLPSYKLVAATVVVAGITSVATAQIINTMQDDKQSPPQNTFLTAQSSCHNSPVIDGLESLCDEVEQKDANPQAAQNQQNVSTPNTASGVSKPGSRSTNPAMPTTSQTTPSNNNSAPTTMSNCFYVNGYSDGKACPINPPSSYSYSASCYQVGAGTYAQCPEYSTITRIVASTENGDSSYVKAYCTFNYPNPPYGITKKVRVFGSSIPDCATAVPN